MLFEGRLVFDRPCPLATAVVSHKGSFRSHAAKANILGYQRGRELDLLLLQLQKGKLALLPLPLGQLDQAAEENGVPPLQRWWRRVFG